MNNVTLICDGTEDKLPIRMTIPTHRIPIVGEEISFNIDNGENIKHIEDFRVFRVVHYIDTNSFGARIYVERLL